LLSAQVMPAVKLHLQPREWVAEFCKVLMISDLWNKLHISGSCGHRRCMQKSCTRRGAMGETATKQGTGTLLTYKFFSF
jgi:hypothetical protein